MTKADRSVAADPQGADVLALRVRVFWVVVAGACDVVFYGALNRAPLSEPALSPRCFVDDVIPFWPWSIVPYLVLISLVFVLVPLIHRRDVFVDTMRAFLAAIVVNFAIWMLWPTHLPRPTDPGDDALFVGAWRWFTAFDHDNNAFPSGHVTVPVVAVTGFARCFPNVRFFVVALLIALLPSILTTRQHTLADVVAGLATAAVGLTVAAVIRRRTV